MKSYSAPSGKNVAVLENGRETDDDYTLSVARVNLFLAREGEVGLEERNTYLWGNVKKKR